LAEQTNTICLNSFDYGMNIGAQKKFKLLRLRVELISTLMSAMCLLLVS